MTQGKHDKVFLEKYTTGEAAHEKRESVSR